MKLTGQFTGARLDLSTWLTQLKEQLETKLHEAARAWLAGVTGRVPVWSGMSQASLLELAGLVNGTLVISPKGGITSRISEGRALGSAIQEITDTSFIITITTDVEHYNIQEYFKVAKGGSPSAPWGSLKAGETAFYSVANTIAL